MSDLLARLRIEASVGDTPATAARVATAIDGVGDAARRTGAAMGASEAGANRMAAGMDRAGDQAQRLDARTRGAASGVALLGGALGAAAVGAFVSDIQKAAFAAAGLELGLGAVTGGAANATSELAFVRQEAGRLGLVVQATAKDFLDLAASTNGTNLMGQKTREIWLATAEAGMALGRSPEQIGRGLTALSQIAGKGVVSMEEVRQQLAEAIPGATVIGARAMDMTTAAFSKLVESGKLTSDVFLPAFAAQLREEFGPAIEAYLNSPLGKARQEIGAFQTSLNDLKAAAGAGFLEGMTEGLAALNAELTDGDTAAQAREIGEALGEGAAAAAEAVAFLVDNIEAFQTAAAAVAGVALARYLGGVAAAAQLTAARLVATGSAAAVARAGMGSLLTLVGGPFGAAFLGAGAAIWLVTDALADAEARAKTAEANTRAYTELMRDTAVFLEDAATQAAAFGENNSGAVGGTNALTGATADLAATTWELASARAEANRQRIEGQIDALAAERADLQPNFLQRVARGALPGTGAGMVGLTAAANLLAPDNSARTAEIDRERAGLRARSIEIALNPANMVPDRPASSGGGGGGTAGGGGGRSRRDPAKDMAEDLAREEAALKSHALAVAAGEAALDEWRVAQAGIEAVARAGTEAVREQAESVERLAIADERIEQAAGLARKAQADTEALKRQAAAAMLGRDALEQLRISEAGLEVLQTARVASLDQLAGPEREAVALAIAAAEAKERQAIATEQAEAAGQSVEQLNEGIAAEERRQASIGRGIEAEVAYARAEFIRQEVERAGLQLTDAAAQGIIEKADALFRLLAVTDGMQAAADGERELRLMRLSNREREIAVRAETILTNLRKRQVELSGEAAAAEADRRARSELEAEETAAAISRITGSLRDGFIRDGKLGMEELGDFAEERLRAAIYDAFLAEPINIVVNATVDIINDLAKQLFTGDAAKGFLSNIFGSLGGFGAVLGNAGIGGAIGGSMGLGSGNGLLDAGLSVGGAALGTYVGSSLGMAGGIGLLGGFSGIAAALGPIMGPLGALAGLALGSLLKDEKRPYTRADIVAQGGQFRVAGTQGADGGSRDVADQLGKAITDSLNAASKLFGIDMTKLEGLYTTAGYVSGGNYKALGGEGFFGGDIRGLIDYFNQAGGDLKGNTLGLGVSFDQVGSAEELAEQVVRETILRAIAAGASDLTDAEQALVAAADSLEEAITLIETARGFGDRLDDMLLELLDPAGFEKKKAMDAVEATYRALKAEAEKLIGAGLLSADTLAKIEQLRDLQLDAALNGVDGAGQGPFAEARDRLQAWLDGLAVSDIAPTGAKAQRDTALEQYQRVLAAAQGGDRGALADLATYADRLLRADRQATGSATQRADLYTQVTADVQQLVQRAAAEEPLNAAAISGPIIAALAGSQTALADVLMTLPPATAAPLLEGILRQPDWATRLLGENVQVPPALQELRDRVMAVGPDAARPIVTAVLTTPAWTVAMNEHLAMTPLSIDQLALALGGLPPEVAGPIIQALSLTPAWGTTAVDYLRTITPSLELLQRVTAGLPPEIAQPIIDAVLQEPLWVAGMLDQLTAMASPPPDIAGPIIRAIALTPGWADKAVAYLQGVEPSLDLLQRVTAGLPIEISQPIIDAVLQEPLWVAGMLEQLSELDGEPPDIAGPIVRAIVLTPGWADDAVAYLQGVEPSLDLLREVTSNLPSGIADPIIAALLEDPTWAAGILDQLREMDGPIPDFAAPIIKALLLTPEWGQSTIDYLATVEPSLELLRRVTEGLPENITGPLIDQLLAEPAWAASLLSQITILASDPAWARLLEQVIGTDLTVSIDDLGEILDRLLRLLSVAKPANDDTGPQILPGYVGPNLPANWPVVRPPVTPGLPGTGDGSGGDGDPFTPVQPVDDGTGGRSREFGIGGQTRRDVALFGLEVPILSGKAAGMTADTSTVDAITALTRSFEARFSALQAALTGGLDGVADATAEGFEQMAGASAEQLDALRDTASAQRVANAHLIAKAA